MQLEGLTLGPGIKIVVPPVPVGYIDIFGGGARLQTNGYQSTSCAIYDNSNNLYVCGRSGSTLRNGTIAKFDSTGTLLWQKTLSSPDTDSINFYSLSLDNSNNIYVTGSYSTDDTSFNTYDVLIVKYDTDGNLQWQKTLGNSTLSQFGFGITVEKSTGNFYVCGGFQSIPSQNTSNIVLLKYNSSGILQWQRMMINSGSGQPQSVPNSLALDSSGNIYIVGRISGLSINSSTLIKYSSSGVYQWQVGLDNGSIGAAYDGIVIDSSDNIYVCGTIGDSTYSGIVVKYNSIGVLQWKRRLGTTTAFPRLSGITLDSSGNIYTVGAGQSYNLAYVIKYNNNGVIQWQRRFSGSVPLQLNSVIVDSLDNLLMTGYMDSSPTKIIMLKVPPTGAPIGTHLASGISFTYSVSVLPEAELTNASVPTTLIPGVPSFTTATLSATASTSSFTNTVTQIP